MTIEMAPTLEPRGPLSELLGCREEIRHHHRTSDHSSSYLLINSKCNQARKIKWAGPNAINRIGVEAGYRVLRLGGEHNLHSGAIHKS